jgi:hypothetical protein
VKAATVPFAERWNGKAWKVTPARAPRGATSSYLDAVSCTSAKSCYAVGGFVSGSTMGSPLAERWNGSRWTIMKSPGVAKAATTFLSGVSCIGLGAAVTCAAVGSYTARPEGNPYYAVAQRMVRGKWSLVASPEAGNNALTSVACSGPKSCFAAGTRKAGRGKAIIEHWNGKKWSLAAAAVPRGSTLSQLNAITCTTRTNCVATGLVSMDLTTQSSLINHWNGRKWAIQPTGAPARAVGASLSGVSCTSGGHCFAVGTYLTNKFGSPPAGFSTHR